MKILRIELRMPMMTPITNAYWTKRSASNDISRSRVVGMTHQLHGITIDI